MQYKIKEHSRAKRVSLKISARNGLIVVVPKGYNKRKIPAIIERRYDWIKQHENKILEYNNRKDYITLPTEIDLHSIGEYWRIIYRQTTASYIKFKEDNDFNLIIYGNIGDSFKVINALNKWINKKAKGELFPLLDAISGGIELPFNDVSVRSQKSRWASCSTKKNINLNQKLIFLPQDLVEYVMIHELCHTTHMNHSKEFWQLVELYCPEYKIYDKEIRKTAWQEYIPIWAEK